MQVGAVPRERILFVAAEAAFFVTHRLPLALAAREHGYDVVVATPDGPLSAVILQHGLPWERIVMRRKTQVVREARAVPNLVRVYRKVRPDLVHHIAIKAVLYGTIAARIARVPAVVNAVTGLGYAFDERRAHTLLGRTLGFAFDHLLSHPRARFIFQNVEDRDTFVNRRWIGAREAELIRGSGVDTTSFAPPSEPPAGPPLVVFASRLLASKGVAEFVEAARMLRGRGVDARFAVVGGPDPQNPETITHAELARWKEEGAVEIFGARRDMPDVLRQASLFVLPTYYREGVPKALIEAAATGLPAITTDTPGCRDIVLHGETGLCVPPRDSHALAEGMESLLRDPVLRSQMGVRARERVLAHFAVEHVVAQTLATYEKLLNVGRAS
ncbi:MAG TPA: glycosyltransferase family 4 protein, partial [Thermoanaerobaculia bacterium]|nr:glycosyltransferase family 4 protein [Thermoanaerobaculia bacterium]